MANGGASKIPTASSRSVLGAAGAVCAIAGSAAKSASQAHAGTPRAPTVAAYRSRYVYLGKTASNSR